MPNRKTIKYSIGGGIILSVFIWMIYSGLSENMVYFLKIDELVAQKIYGKNVRLNGTVATGTIKKTLINGRSRYQFKVTDGTHFIKVDYTGIVPDTFEEEKDVILEGKYSGADGLFSAAKLMTKCPSKYDAEDTEEVKKHKNKI